MVPGVQHSLSRRGKELEGEIDTQERGVELTSTPERDFPGGIIGGPIKILILKHCEV